MNQDSQKVSVIVLSYDRPAFIVQALDSINGQSYPNLEVIVVDNKSHASQRIAEIVRQYRGVRLIQNSDNLGFTGGMNRGIEAATGAYVHCTLDDVILHPDFIANLVAHAQRHPSDGLLSGIIYNEDRKTIRCAGGEFVLAPIYRQTHFGSGEQDSGRSEPFNVKFIPGGVIFCKLEVMRRLNGFRSDFFMYSEDVELCARVLKSGNTITVVPQAKVFVLDAPHAFTPAGISFHKIKNLFALYLLHARLRVLPEFFFRYGLLHLLRTLSSDRKMLRPMLKALGWLILKAPLLMGQRIKGNRGSKSLYAD